MIQKRKGIYRVPDYIIRIFQRTPFNLESARRDISFRQKLAVTIAISLIFLVLTMIPLAFTTVWNLSTALSNPDISYLSGSFMALLGVMLGSTVTVGAAPIITGYIVYGLLTESGIVEVSNESEAQSLKFISVVSMALIECFACVCRPELGLVLVPSLTKKFLTMFGTGSSEALGWFFIYTILFVQLFVAVMFLYFLDRVGETFSFGSMTGAYIVLGVMVSYGQALQTLIYNTWNNGIKSTIFFSQTNRGITWLALIFSLLFVLGLSILEARTVLIRVRSQMSDKPFGYPYKVFFLGNVPTLIGAIYLGIWGQLLMNFKSVLSSTGSTSLMQYVMNPHALPMSAMQTMNPLSGFQKNFSPSITTGLFGLTNMSVSPNYLPGFFDFGWKWAVWFFVSFVISTLVFMFVAACATKMWCTAEQITPESQSARLYGIGIRAPEGRGTYQELVEHMAPYFRACVIGSSCVLVLSMAILNFLGPFANIPSSSLILTIGIVQGYLQMFSRS